jgi:hypothetical protein
MTNSLLRITNGTITKNLATGDDMRLMQYKPTIVPTFGAYVEDQVRFSFVGSSGTVNKANFNAINLLLEQARNYHNTETGARVYLEYDPDGSGTYYRSQVTNGFMELTDETIGNRWDSAYLYVILHVTRDPFWEGALTQLPLTNSYDTGDTAGLRVDNTSIQVPSSTTIAWDDGTPILWDTDDVLEWDDLVGVQNFVDISGDDILGDLPANLKIEIEHTKSGAAKTKEFFIWHNVYSFPGSFTHMLEAEDATGATVTAHTDATCQDGGYATLAWTATTETQIAEWTLSDELVGNAAGGRFAVLARWRGAFPYTNCWTRLVLLTSNNKVLWRGDLVNVSSTRELVLLNTMRLPPYLANMVNTKSIKLRLYALRNQSGTHSIDLDYLQFSPISGDAGWKRFLSVDDGIAYQEKFIHDALERQDYLMDTTDGLIAEFTAYGGPILLIPGRSQRIYFNTCDKDGAAKISQTFKIKVWYRPTRSAL